MLKKFIPVIHITDNLNDLKINLKIINDNNVKDIMLISHGYLNYIELIDLGNKIKLDNSNLNIGYNFLDLNSIDVFNYLISNKIKVDYVWIDNSYVGLNNTYANDLKDKWLEYKSIFNDSIYLGGVAFKYLPQPQYIEKAIEDSKTMMDVVTTTGSGTGSEISKEKINLFDKIINKEIPLAVASGISIDNLDYLFNYVNYFLVSSSISKSDSLFDENKFKEFNNIFLELKNDKCNKVSILFN